MKKKLISFMLLCTVFIGMIISASSVVYATDVQQGPNREMNTRLIPPGGIGALCRFAADCLMGLICFLGTCLSNGDGGGSASMGMCQSTNSYSCRFECNSCGYKSIGTGPAVSIPHGCR